MSLVHAGARSTAAIVRDVVSEVRHRNVPFMAGSIAYSAFVSLFPLLLLSLLVASAIAGSAVADYVVARTGSYLTPTGRELVVDAILGAGARVDVSALGILVLGWGVLKLFRSLDTAFSTLYGTGRSNGLADQLRDGLVVVGAIALAGAAMVATGGAYALLEGVPYLGVLNPLLLVAGLTVVFFPIYYVYPDRDLAARQVLPGTVFAAVGWVVLQAVFQVYVSATSTTELYGVVGGVLLIVTWLYVAALVLLCGATVNVVLARHRGSASTAPTPQEASAPHR